MDLGRPDIGPRRAAEGERGQTLVLFVFALAALMGLVALTIDVGLAFVARRDMQNAADSAVLAGAARLMEGAPASVAAAEAQEWAERNGYIDGEGGVSMSVNVPPTSGAHSGDSNYIEVVVQQEIDTVLATAAGKDTWEVTARAVAGVDSQPKPYGIIVLNETACEALELNGNVDLTINGGGTFTNSECADEAFSATGNVDVNTGANDVMGGWKLTGNVDVNPTPTPAGHIEDPLAGLPVPTPPSGPQQNCPTLNGNGSYTFQPGVYNCTISPNGNWNITFKPGDYLITGGLNFNGNINLTFGAGTYTLQGQGLKVNGNADISADDVTFYVDDGCVTLNGNANLDLFAPDTGTYEGILIFQSRSNTCTVNLNGNATAGNWGTVYAAGAQIRLVGNANTSFQFVSDTLLMNGNTDVVIDFDEGVVTESASLRLVE